VRLPVFAVLLLSIASLFLHFFVYFFTFSFAIGQVGFW
jgi:hypothetical protein